MQVHKPGWVGAELKMAWGLQFSLAQTKSGPSLSEAHPASQYVLDKADTLLNKTSLILMLSMSNTQDAESDITLKVS
jgi:hypothetical protein